jgi:glycosyltransferase involved in cell wall biosynthesis
MWFLTPECLTMEVPYILTLWDLQHRLQPYFPEVSKEGEWNSREGTYSQTLRRASFIITGTNIGKSEIEKFYQVPEERIKVLPLPAPNFNQSNLDVNIDVNILKKKYRIEKPYLFYPAQFWPHKNHANLLKSVQILKDQFNLVFDMVFTGSNKGNLNYVQNLSVELGIQEQVKFLGFVSQADLIALYRHAFALTFVSFFGPDNIPPLEAFTLGCPVVAAKVAGSEEQLGDAALFIDPKDARQIAEAVKLIHDNWEFRNTLIQKGFSHASKWSPEDYLNGVFQILDEFQSIRKCWGN